MRNKKNNKHFTHDNQNSFFFDDFIESTQNKKLYKSKIYEDRLYALFSFFFSLILIFSISIFSTSIQESNFQGYKKAKHNSLLLRRDIVDRNGELMAQNINSYHAAVNPSFIKNLTEKLLLWTGERWIISLSKNSGEKTIHEKNKEKKIANLSKESESNIAQKLFSSFPDAKLIDVEEEEEEDDNA